MAGAELKPRDGRWTRTAIVGALSLAVGLVTLAWLIYVGNSTSPSAERALMGLGLAGGALVSALAQALVFIGGWMIWRANRRR